MGSVSEEATSTLFGVAGRVDGRFELVQHRVVGGCHDPEFGMRIVGVKPLAMLAVCATPRRLDDLAEWRQRHGGRLADEQQRAPSATAVPMATAVMVRRNVVSTPVLVANTSMRVPSGISTTRDSRRSDRPAHGPGGPGAKRGTGGSP
jgi:hypothetical protein